VIIPIITTRHLQILEIIPSTWVDEVRFYNVYLSDSEVQQIYGGGLGDVGQPWIVVSSPNSATAATGMVFTYQITATNGPTGYSLN
jgi:presenilin-like A22 family membrane protease